MRVVLILFLVCESCNSEYTFEFIYGGKYGFQLNKIILASQHLGSLTLDIYQEGMYVSLQQKHGDLVLNIK